MKNNSICKYAVLVAAGLLLGSAMAFPSAKITIVNGNAAGVGFNDSTSAAPVGGNTATTLGQQRLNAFQYAAGIWGGTLDSNVEIKILATFEPLSCNATSATLGSAGTMFIFSDFPGTSLFPGAEFPNTWYHSALAKKRVGFDFAPYDTSLNQADLRARFNSNLGNVGCLTGTGWYLGFDGNHGSQIDLVTVLLHEFAHGLGFSQFANVSNGAQILGLTDIYGRHLLDTVTNKTWDQMTDLERKASAINPRRVAWTGAEVTSAVPSVLSPGTPLLRINSPLAIQGVYSVGTAAYGPVLVAPGVTGDIVVANDAANASGPSTTDGCTAITNAAAVAGKIALVDRGTCGFVVKVKNAQDAGAIAVVVADNVAGGPPAGLGGADPAIIIPSVRITQADGNTIKAQLASGIVSATLGVDLTVRAGADASGKALLYTPNPVQSGSTISHWDTIAFPNQLMEPAINSDLSHSVAGPQDLTLALLRDVGWFPDADTDGLADNADCEAHSDFRPSVIIGKCDSGVKNWFFTSGCTVSDYIRHVAGAAKNHGAFVSGVSDITNQLKAAGIITGRQKASIESCAAGAPIP
jgi:hypothetical protein